MDLNEEEILTEDTSSLLVRYSIPAIIGMIVNALYNLADSIFVADGAGEVEYAGVVIGTSLVMVIFAIGLGIGQGAASLISISLGKNDHDKIKRINGVMYSMVLIASVIFALMGIFFAEEIVKVFGAAGPSIEPAKQYTSIFFVGSIFIFFSMAGNNTLRAVGEFRLATIAMVIGIVTNIILDPIFIYDWGFGMGASGAAIASVLGYVVTALFYVLYVFRKVPSIKFKVTELLLDFTIVSEIFFVGLPGLIRNISLSIAMLAFNNALKNYDLVYLNVFGTFTRVSYLLLMPSYGIIQGMMPIVGVNYGAGETERVRSVAKLSNRMVHVYLVAAGLLLGIVFAEPILNLFVDGTDPGADEFMEHGRRAFMVMMPLQALMGIQLVESSLLQAIGVKYVSLLVSSLRVIIVVPLVLIIGNPDIWGLKGILWSYPITDALIFIITTVLYMKTIKKMTATKLA